MLPIAILAGGLATRMRPLTETVPKSMLSVAGEPFIYHQLRLLRKNGFSKVVLCIGYLGEQIVDAVGDGSAFDLEVLYSTDGPELLGTGGALKKALPMLDEAFFVMYGDSYLTCDYKDIVRTYKTCGKPVLMTILRNDGMWDKSNVLYSKNKMLYDKVNTTYKMKYIDYGLSIIKATCLRNYSDSKFFDLSCFYNRLSNKNEIFGYIVKERFYEIGSMNGMAETNDLLIYLNQ